MSSTIPTDLPPRYEIRELRTQQHLEWATAIVAHSNSYCGHVFPVLYDSLARRFRDGFAGTSYLVRHGIASGLSFGIFDREYKFKHPESAAAGGKFIWDGYHEGLTSEEILERMDFPLVSVAMAYDGYYRINPESIGGVSEQFPVMHDAWRELENLASRPRPQMPGQVVFRNATSTRKDYEGQKLMKHLAYFLMREAARQGYTAIQMEMMNSAVKHVWLHPPAPFKSELVGEFEIGELKKSTGFGEEYFPYSKVKQAMSRVYVTLNQPSSDSDVM